MKIRPGDLVRHQYLHKVFIAEPRGDDQRNEMTVTTLDGKESRRFLRSELKILSMDKAEILHALLSQQKDDIQKSLWAIEEWFDKLNGECDAQR